MKIKVNGVEMRYEITGEGRTLVLIHGYSDNMNMWYNQVPEFSKRYRVLTYDVRGFGETEKAEPYSMGGYAEDLYELLRVLGIKKACVLGYSMGGRIGLHLTFRHPEMVVGLVFANSGVGGAATPEREARWKMMVEILQTGGRDAISEMMATGSFSPDFKERSPATFQRYKNIKMENDPSSYMPIMMAMMAETTQLADLNRVGCPALIIAGEKDGFMDVSLARDMKASLTEATVEILPSGHAAALEVPEAFNRTVLDFLEELRWPER